MKIETSIAPISKTAGQGYVEPKTGPEGGAREFSGLLGKMFESVNQSLQEADEMASRLAAGRDIDIPEAMIAINKADISFRLFVQIRNKALAAYEEIMRLQF